MPVGTVRLTVLSSGVARIDLLIVSLISRTCEACAENRITNVPAVAGTGFVALDTSGRRRRLGELPPPRQLEVARASSPAPLAVRAHGGGRALQTSCSSCHDNVYGDVDGNGVFDVGDSLMVQLIALGTRQPRATLLTHTSVPPPHTHSLTAAHSSTLCSRWMLNAMALCARWQQVRALRRVSSRASVRGVSNRPIRHSVKTAAASRK